MRINKTKTSHHDHAPRALSPDTLGTVKGGSNMGFKMPLTEPKKED